MFIFIDESGDMEPDKGTPYFVIAAIFYYEKNVQGINSIIKKHNTYILQNGWPASLEIKATHLYNYKRLITDVSMLTFNPKLYLQDIFKDINKLDIKVGLLIHETSNQGPIFRILHKEKIYNYLSKNLYIECMPFLRDTMDICVDQRNITLVKKQKSMNLSEQRLNLNYIGYISNALSFVYCQERQIQPVINICFDASQNRKGLQLADYVAWATRKKYEGKPYWFELLKRVDKIEKKDNFQ